MGDRLGIPGAVDIFSLGEFCPEVLHSSVGLHARRF